MLAFTEGQWNAIQARDASQFVAAVCDQFLSERPDMAASPRPLALKGRMQAAHDAATRMGFTSTAHIVMFMYLAADGPQMIHDAALAAYLRKPGATPEQRLDDLMAVMKRQLKEIR